jgi:serine/threonine protein kinase
VWEAGRCAHIIDYYTGFEQAAGTRGWPTFSRLYVWRLYGGAKDVITTLDGRYFLAIELADRGTLRDWERDGRLGALSWAGRKALCRDLCAGMEFLHDRAGVVHRDLKPENVLFKSEATRGGRCDTLKARPRPVHCAPLVSLSCSLPDCLGGYKVLTWKGAKCERSCDWLSTGAAVQIADFGLSRSIADSRSRHKTLSVGAGTDCWMPPEGLAGKCGNTASLTFSYDVHPIGSLLYCAGPSTVRGG